MIGGFEVLRWGSDSSHESSMTGLSGNEGWQQVLLAEGFADGFPSARLETSQTDGPRGQDICTVRGLKEEIDALCVNKIQHLPCA